MKQVRMLVWTDEEGSVVRMADPGTKPGQRAGLLVAVEVSTPDFLMAMFLCACLDAFDAAVKARTEWYRPKDHPETSRPTEPTEPRVTEPADRVRARGA